MILKKYFYFALLVLASLWVMPSCSEDNDIPSQEIPENPENNGGEHVPNPAGDDFYMFVNGEWHESLTDLSTPQGYSYDIVRLLNVKIAESYKSLEAAQLIQESSANLQAGGQDANLQRVDEVIKELLADVETKTDAYQTIGKMIGMSLIEEQVKLF